MKRPVRYKCGCVRWITEVFMPNPLCEEHGEGIVANGEIIKDIKKDMSKTRQLEDKEIVSAGDLMQFRVKDRLIQTEAKLICGKVTVKEMKRLLYDEVDIEFYRVIS